MKLLEKLAPEPAKVINDINDGLITLDEVKKAYQRE